MTSFLSPTKISAGVNALEHLPFDLAAMGADKPMVILDRESQEAGLTKPLIQAFKASGMTIGFSNPAPLADSPGSQETAEFIRTLYHLYQDKGYNALMALGGSAAADAAKAVGIAVALGPETLNRDDISGPLPPLVYLPSGTTGLADAAGAMRFNGKTVVSPFLAPDIALIDPKLMRPQDRADILDQGLISLALGSEVFALSQSAPARAYAATIVSLAAEAIKPLLDSGLKGPDSLKAGQKEAAQAQKRLAQAAVMAGCLSAGHSLLYTLTIGQEMAARGRIPMGQIMAIVVPAVLEAAETAPGLGDLFCHLAGAAAYSRVPAPQRPAAALGFLRDITHQLYGQSRGLLPRTLDEAGWQPGTLDSLADDITSARKFSPAQTAMLNQIFTLAWDGSPAGQTPPELQN